MKKFFWTITALFALSVAGLLIFYAYFGHSLIEAMVKGEAPGVLNKVMRERPYPLEYYLNQGDWLAAGAPVMSAIVWFLTALAAFPREISSFFRKLHSSRKRSLWFALGFLGLALLTPFPIEQLVLVKLLAIWSGVTGLFLWKMRDFSLGKLGKAAAAVAILEFFLFSVFFLIKDPLFLENVFVEYAFFENLQFVFYFFGGLFFMVLCFKSGRPGPLFSWKRSFFLFFALFLFFVAGEEISWGQRIFGFETPAFLDNVQNETNIHNLSMFNSDFILTSLMIVLAAIIPLMDRAIPAFRNWIRRLGFPILPPLAAFSVILGLLIHTNELHAYYRNTDEIRELFISLGFLIFAVHVYFQNLSEGSND